MPSSPDPLQSFENHARFVTGYHRVGTGLILVLFVFFVYRTISDFSIDRLADVLLVVAVGLVAFYARSFPIGVQDRVIRNEERLRLAQLLPADLRERAGALSTDQLIALRFASDAELPELVRRVLDEDIRDSREIKRSIREWRPDHQRI